MKEGKSVQYSTRKKKMHFMLMHNNCTKMLLGQTMTKQCTLIAIEWFGNAYAMVCYGCTAHMSSLHNFKF